MPCLVVVATATVHKSVHAMSCCFIVVIRVSALVTGSATSSFKDLVYLHTRTPQRVEKCKILCKSTRRSSAYNIACEIARFSR